MGPNEFDKFFRRLGEAAGVTSQSGLADALGVHRSAVTQAKNKGAVPQNWILKLARRYNLEPGWLESGAGQMRPGRARDDGSEFFSVPKVRARLCAGGGSFETDDAVEGYYSFRREFLLRKGRPERMALMDVVGNSMEPEIKHGDMALIDQGQTAVLAHAIYAVGVDDTVMVKRVEKQPGALVLLSDNKEYAPIRLRGEEIASLRIIGRVIWISREL